MRDHHHGDDPYIIQVGVTSTPAQEDTYTLGETIELTAKFSIDVDVDGNPGLGMWVGDNWRQASTTVADSFPRHWSTLITAGSSYGQRLFLSRNCPFIKVAITESAYVQL